jgi:hypothetical protein
VWHEYLILLGYGKQDLYQTIAFFVQRANKAQLIRKQSTLADGVYFKKYPRITPLQCIIDSCLLESRPTMAPWKAARAGDHVDQIDTPALILDMDAFERNLGLLQNALRVAASAYVPMPKATSVLKLHYAKLQRAQLVSAVKKSVRQPSLSPQA